MILKIADEGREIFQKKEREKEKEKEKEREREEEVERAGARGSVCFCPVVRNATEREKPQAACGWSVFFPSSIPT